MTDTIDVWRIRPLLRAGDVASLRAILPVDEISRAERFTDEARRRASITSRAAMRMLIAHYTHIPADELRFVSGKNGKPHLDESQNEKGITFNFSDSGEMALLAVAVRRDVGVDLEKLREVPRATEIVARQFDSHAAEEFRRAPDSEKSRLFLQNWARHEALLKAKAATIWRPHGDPVALPDMHAERLYTVRDVDAGESYVGALAAAGNDWSLAVKDYRE